MHYIMKYLPCYNMVG